MLISAHEEIERIQWRKQRRNTKLKAKHVVIVPMNGNHDLLIAELEDGTFVSSHDISGKAYMPGRYPWMKSTINALVMLGAVTKAVATQFLSDIDKRHDQEEARAAAKSLRAVAQNQGLTLTEEQQAFIDKHMPEKPGSNDD